MNNIILDIKRGINVESLLQNCILDIFQNGTTDRTCLEMLSLIKLYQPDIFSKYEESILMKMGLFYKPIKPKTFEDAIFQIYREEINDTEDTGFTPVQAQIIKKINDNNIFSFSSPTSTGKSYVFRYLIKEIKTDSVIIVPSRALINEYFRILNEVFKENKEVNVLTFVDIINTKKAKRNVFIITPERTNELFKLKEQLNVGLILLDEAQLSDDKSVRGLYYDSVIRRITKQFKNAKLVFAYPFIANPEMQFIRNDITIDCKESVSYSQKNVGQIFFSFDNQGNFYHFGISKNTFGNKIKTNFDPLLQVIHRDGTALIYCSKAKIYNKQIFHDFRDYIFACPKRTEVEAKILIEKFRTLIGASDKETGDYRSTMVNFLKRGIVVHHGSLPLSARTILEEFTRKGFCRLCFATSTLDQGINMPFDLVWIDRFQPSKPLSVKNLIGRAGRSTSKPKFDFGQIVIKDASKQQLRKLYSDDFAREVWLNQLLIHIKNPAKDNVIGTLKKNYSSCLFFFIKANRVKFITTNYPVQRLKLKDNNTIIMTLNKEYCVMLAKNPSQRYKRYQVCNASDNIVKYINYILSQGATSLINDYNYYEKSQSLPQKDFEIMFNRAGYLNIFKGQ